MMWKVRGVCRNGFTTDLILLLVFLVLGYIFLTRRGYISRFDTMLSSDATNDVNSHNQLEKRSLDDLESPKLVPSKATSLTAHEKAQDDIDLRIKRIDDVRDAKCEHEDVSAQVPCSIIIHFFDYSFHDMKYTLSSVMQFTPSSLIREIIIVDDGSTLDYIIRESVAYVDVLPSAVLLRREQQQGAASARTWAASKAVGANLVFLDPSVIVTPGWLAPLAHIIQHEQRVIAMPHMDRINDPVSYDYVKVASGFVPTFNWNFDIASTNSFDKKDALEWSEAAVVRGNVFAVTKIYLQELHGLDEWLSEGGGDMLELSFRTAMCGGKIKILPCSRVGVLNIREPVKVVNTKNIWYISELWLGSYKDNVYKQLKKEPSAGVTESDRKRLAARKSELSDLSCRDFSWYLQYVAVDAYIPANDVARHGILQITNGRCVRLSRKDMRVDLGSCSAEQERCPLRDMIVELTADGLLRSIDKCLAVQGSAYILGETCDKNNDHQQWTYDDKQRLVNKWSGYCILHVTDPDPKLSDVKRQIAMAQKCSADSTGDKREFSSWKFLPIH